MQLIRTFRVENKFNRKNSSEFFAESETIDIDTIKSIHMDSMAIANDKNNDAQSREMQYLAPPAPHHIIISSPEQTHVNGPIPEETRQIPRNMSTGTIQELAQHRQMSRIGSTGTIHDLALSRRPSAIVAAMQRPSVQRSLFIECVLCCYYYYRCDHIGGRFFVAHLSFVDFLYFRLMNGRMLCGSKTSIRAIDDSDDDSFVRLEPDPEYELRMQNRRLGDDALTTALSAFYAKLVVVLGIAFPVTDILGAKTPNVFYQGFYLYLYIVSVTFVAFMYVSRMRTRKAHSANAARAKGWARLSIYVRLGIFQFLLIVFLFLLIRQ